MKVGIALTAIAALGITACTTTAQDHAGLQTTPAFAASAQRYDCDSGETVAAIYPNTDSATIEYQGRVYKMNIAVSASGARYVGEGLEWWTKGNGSGSEGTLLQHQADGTSGAGLEYCTAR